MGVYLLHLFNLGAPGNAPYVRMFGSLELVAELKGLSLTRVSHTKVSRTKVDNIKVDNIKVDNSPHTPATKGVSRNSHTRVTKGVTSHSLSHKWSMCMFLVDI